MTDPSALTGHNYFIGVNGTAPSQSYTVYDSDLGGAVVKTDTFKPGQAITFDGITTTIAGAPVDGDQFQIKPSTNTLKLFDMVDRTVAELRTPLRGQAEISQNNSGRIRDLDAVMGNLQNVRSQVGERMNNIDGTEARMAALKQYSKSEQSAAEDLDMTPGHLRVPEPANRL